MASPGALPSLRIAAAVFLGIAAAFSTLARNLAVVKADEFYLQSGVDYTTCEFSCTAPSPLM